MHYVYLLLLKDKSFYTGRTDDLKFRFTEHEQGRVTSTKNKRPLKLIYYEGYIYKKDAVDRKLYLKTGDGRREIRKQLKYLISKEL